MLQYAVMQNNGQIYTLSKKKVLFPRLLYFYIFPFFFLVFLFFGLGFLGLVFLLLLL